MVHLAPMLVEHVRVTSYCGTEYTVVSKTDMDFYLCGACGPVGEIDVNHINI